MNDSVGYDKVMRRVLLILFVLPLAAEIGGHWIRYKGGPFEVLTDAGPKDGRETLVKFEEFRHALGQILGENDLQMPLRVRILLFKSGAPQTPEPVIRGRDQYNIVLTAGRPIPHEVFARMTELFMETNSARMPERLERGIVSLFSTIEVTGIRITLGEPPPHPDMDWARVHLLAVDPQYYGNLRVLTYNLRKGVAEDPAFKNAFGKTPEQIELEAQQHLAAGRFQAASISPLPMSPTDFPERGVEPGMVQLAIADLLLGDSSRTAYRELIAQKTWVPEAWEGLGMLALRDQQTGEAQQDFASAMEAGAKSPVCYMEYAKLEKDDAKARAALEQATKLNPKLAEPYYRMSLRESNWGVRVAQLKQAAKLDPRNLTYWQALAEAYEEDHQFSKALEAWRSAEQAATTPGDRAHMQHARLQVEEKRLDWEAEEKRRKAEEEAREIDRLKEQARAEVRALETRANQGQSPAQSNAKVVPWWDGPQPSGVAQGTLKQIDCLGKRYRLVVEDDQHKTVKLLIVDPAKIAIAGGGDLNLSCGVQKLRRVKIEYFPKPNAKLATAGEVASIELE